MIARTSANEEPLEWHGMAVDALGVDLGCVFTISAMFHSSPNITSFASFLHPAKTTLMDLTPNQRRRTPWRRLRVFTLKQRQRTLEFLCQGSSIGPSVFVVRSKMPG
jgi:hypothetical protein